MDERKCHCCGNNVEKERVEILDSFVCSTCARKRPEKKKKGYMHYAHKTAPTIQVVDADYYDTEWKKYNPSFGRGSGVHKMSPRTAGTK